MANAIALITEAVSRFIIDQGHIGRRYQATYGRRLSSEGRAW